MGKKLPANAGDTRCGFDPWVRKAHWNRKYTSPQCSGLENFMGRGERWATIHGIAKSQMWLSTFYQRNTRNFLSREERKEEGTRKRVQKMIGINLKYINNHTKLQLDDKNFR